MMTLEEAKTTGPFWRDNEAWQNYITWAYRHRKPQSDAQVCALADGFQAGWARHRDFVNQKFTEVFS